MKITRSGSIILTSFLIAASIVLFAAAGIILDKPATQMQLEQQTAQAQSSTDIVVGTTAETPIVSQQTAEVVRTVEDLGGSSLNSITFNPRWRQCFTLSHDNNGIIPGLLQDIPTDSSKEIQQRLIQQNKVAMLFAAGIDEWVCWYYATNFKIQNIPDYTDMQKDVNIHEETWEKLRFFLDNCIFEPTELNGAYWNDGLKQDNGNYTLVSRKTTFENVSATIIFCGDRKPVEPPQTTVTTAKPEEPVATIKNNCGNIQRPQPPEKAPILPPSKEKPKPEPCPSPTTTTTTCPKPHPTTTTTLPKCELPGTSPKSTIGDKDNPVSQEDGRHTVPADGSPKNPSPDGQSHKEPPPPAKLEDPPHNDTYIDGSGGGTASDGDETITDNTGTHVVPNDSPPQPSVTTPETNTDHSGNSGGIMPQ